MYGFLLLTLAIVPRETQVVSDTITMAAPVVRPELQEVVQDYGRCINQATTGKNIVPTAAAFFEQGIAGCREVRNLGLKEAEERLARAGVSKKDRPSEAEKAFLSIDTFYRTLAVRFDQDMQRLSGKNASDK